MFHPSDSSEILECQISGRVRIGFGSDSGKVCFSGQVWWPKMSGLPSVFESTFEFDGETMT